MPDERGEKRRDRNRRFGVPSPPVVVPDEAEHVWEWFWKLSNRRRAGPESLTYAEIGEWQRLTGQQVLPEEVEMLMKMDDSYLATVRDEQAAAAERQREKSRNG